VHHTTGVMGGGLRPRLILGALVDDLAVIHVYLVRVHDLPSGDRGDMQVLDAMQVGQCKGKPLSFFGCDKFIDIDRVNGLLACLIATTVAKGLPASGETSQKDISHDSYSWCHVDADRRPPHDSKHDWRPGPKWFTLLYPSGTDYR
jgi:hypothetical protein